MNKHDTSDSLWPLWMLAATLGVALAFIWWIGVAASAGAETQDDGHVTVAWKVPLTSTEWNDAGQPTGNALNGIIWPQDFHLEAVTAGADVNALDGIVTECGVYQIDVYPNGAKAQALIATGTLDWGDDHGLVESWKFIDNGDCLPEPEPCEWDLTLHPADERCVPPTPTPEPEPAPDPEPTPEPEPVPPFECDGDGDGINEHSYNDPSDGVCADQAPPVTVPPVEVEVEGAASSTSETLPETGSPYVWPAAVIGVFLLFIGGVCLIADRFTES